MVIWLIGLSGAGKTTIGKEVFQYFKKIASNTVFLDGDVLRDVWQDSLGHTIEGRKKNSDRLVALCKMLDDQDINVVCSVLSIFPDVQQKNRILFSNYFQVYLKVDLEELRRRDSKGLYKGAQAGSLMNVVGFDIEFPEPFQSDLVIQNQQTPIKEVVDNVIEKIEEKSCFFK